MRLERIPEEDHEVEPPLGDRGADLLIAAERSAQERRDRNVQLTREARAGRAGCVPPSEP
jgi:hypothetical protein